jgi:hypothetical protein
VFLCIDLGLNILSFPKIAELQNDLNYLLFRACAFAFVFEYFSCSDAAAGKMLLIINRWQ